MENNKNKTVDIISGGKLGDFIHSLVVPKYLYDLYGIKTDLKISNSGDKFRFGLDKAHIDLKTIIEMQPYINSFEILHNYDFKYNRNNVSYDYDMSSFRHSRFLFKEGWTDLFLKTYLTDVSHRISNLRIIDIPFDKKYEDVVILHRRDELALNNFCSDVYEQLINDNDCKFISFDEKLYQNFKFRDKVEPIFVSDFFELFQILRSCRLYVGNLTGITAAAHVVNCARLVELLPDQNSLDEDIHSKHYTLDLKYYNNISYMLNEHKFLFCENNFEKVNS